MAKFISFVFTLLFLTVIMGVSFLFFAHVFAKDWLDRNRTEITATFVVIAAIPWVYSAWKIKKDPRMWL